MNIVLDLLSCLSILSRVVDASVAEAKMPPDTCCFICEVEPFGDRYMGLFVFTTIVARGSLLSENTFSKDVGTPS